MKEQELEIKFKQFEEMEKRMVEIKDTSKNQSITNSFDPSSFDKLMRNHQSYLLSQNKENVSSNCSYSQPKIDESIDSLRDDFSENKDNKPSILGQNCGLNGTTDISSYTKCKPPSIRKYCRDSSAGAKLRYNYSRENIKHCASTVKEESNERTENNTARTEHRIYLHKQNSSGYCKSKEIIKDLKPPREKKERRYSYVSRKYIDDH